MSRSIRAGLTVLGWMLVFVIAPILLSGCATKRYGRLQPVAPLETQMLTCDGIDLELARVGEFERQVEEGSEITALSVLAFANDLGIGNAIEKDAALDTARERRGQLTLLRVQRGCPPQ
jgi:hypothetical protein